MHTLHIPSYLLRSLRFTMTFRIKIPLPMSSSDAMPRDHDQGVRDCAVCVCEIALGSLPVFGTPGRPTACAVTRALLGVPLNMTTTKILATLLASSVAEVESVALLAGELTSNVYAPAGITREVLAF